MPDTPGADVLYEWCQRVAQARQAVLDLGWHGSVVLSSDKAQRGESLQLSAQDPGTDALSVEAEQQRLLELTVTQRPVPQIPDDA